MKKAAIIKFPLSTVTLFVLFAFILLLSYFYHAPNPLSWDTIGYHSYFVELVSDGNLRIENLSYYQEILNQYDNANSLYQFVPTENGNYIPKYSIGWSILNAPFLFFGHLFALWFNYPTDGFSLPYQIATLISSLTYTFVGLFFCKKFLKEFFNEKTVSLLLILLVLGTNFLHMNYACIALIHVYLFPLYAALIYFSYSFHKKNNLRDALIIGVLLGLMVLSRPTEVIAIVIPLLYGVTSVSTLNERLKDVFTTKYYFLSVFLFVIIISLQFFYWKYSTGEWIYYSYKNPGEGLDLDNPHLLEVLFSFRRGWWLYTPIMIFILPAFFYCYKYYKSWFWPLLLFTACNLYIISSWTSWWYAGSFSSRALEHSYPIYILLIGFFIYQLKNLKLKITLALLSLFMIFNLFQTWQVQHGILDLFRMSRPYYFSIFGQTSPPTEKQKKLLLIDRGLTVFDNKDQYNLIYSKEIKLNPDTLSTVNPYSKPIKFQYNELSNKDHLWFVASVKVNHIKDSLNDQKPAFHLCANALNEYGVYGWRNETITTLCKSSCQLQINYLTPHLRSKKDSISVGLWHQSGPTIKVENFSLEVYEPQ